MKRKFFHLTSGHDNSSFFPTKRNTAFRMAHHREGGGSGSDEDEEAKKQLLKEVRAAAKDEIKNDKNYASFEAMTEQWKTMPIEAIRSLCDKETGVLARFSKLDAQMLEFETRASKSGDKELTLRGQIEAWVEANKTALEGIRNKKKMPLEPMELNTRVATSPMLPANTYVGTGLPVPFYEPGVHDVVRVQPTFWDYVTKGATDSPVYAWVNKTNPQGAAGFVGPGVLKPAISFQLTTAISNYKKIAATDKVAQELLWDVKGMETLIKDELRYQILIALNSALLAGAGSATVPTGIRNLSVAYTLVGVETTNPNYMDALRAAVAQLRSGNLTGPITIFINPVDSANMDLTKATTSGNYMLPPFVTSDGRTIAGAAVVEEPGIPVGFFQAGFMQYYRVLIYKGLILTFGWENDDFTKNLITYLGEMAIHQFFNTQYTGAFIYDSFANVLAAITATP